MPRVLHNISEWGEIIILPKTIYILIHCNQTHILLSKQFHILPNLQIIPSHSAHIFNQDRPNFPGLHFFHHGKKAGAVKSCAANSIIRKMNQICKAMFLCILLQKLFLIGTLRLIRHHD